MAKSEGETVAISDAGPIIHLDELASLYFFPPAEIHRYLINYSDFPKAGV